MVYCDGRKGAKCLSLALSQPPIPTAQTLRPQRPATPAPTRASRISKQTQPTPAPILKTAFRAPPPLQPNKQTHPSNPSPWPRQNPPERPKPHQTTPFRAPVRNEPNRSSLTLCLPVPFLPTAFVGKPRCNKMHQTAAHFPKNTHFPSPILT